MNIYYFAFIKNIPHYIYDLTDRSEYQLYDYIRNKPLLKLVEKTQYESFEEWEKSFYGVEYLIILPMYSESLPSMEEINRCVSKEYPELLL